MSKEWRQIAEEINAYIFKYFMRNILFICLVFCSQLIPNQNAFSGEGHDAGRAWAESKGIDNPDDCLSKYPGRWENDNINNSPSFTEGCLEYLQEEGITNDDNKIIKNDSEDNNEGDSESEDE
jgi:hypothetical protein